MNWHMMAVAYLVIGFLVVACVATEIVAEWVGLTLGLIILVLAFPSYLIDKTARGIEAVLRFVAPKNSHRG